MTNKNAEKQKQNDVATILYLEKRMIENNYEIAKQWIYYLLAIFGIFGAIIPFAIALFQASRVDTAIDKMENNFKELAGKKLRDPKIVCKINNESLFDNIVVINNSKTTYIDIYNEGDGVSGPINAYLYFSKLPQKITYNTYCLYSEGPQMQDLPSENIRYPTKFSAGRADHLSPKDVLNIRLCLRNESEENYVDIEAMLKVYYGETKPIEVPFIVRVSK